MCRLASSQVFAHSEASNIPPLMLITTKPPMLPIDEKLKLPIIEPIQRSVSCIEPRAFANQRFVVSSRGVSFKDKTFRLQTQAKVQQLIATASSESSSSANAILAKKALKFRKVVERGNATIAIASC